MRRIGIIDYGIGNLRSVVNALRFVGAESIVSANPCELGACDAIVFPGVGAFGYGMEALRRRRLDDLILETADTGKPLLGICLGMQLLFERSSEFGEHEGLGIIPGEVDRFEGDPQKTPLRLPNVGWLPLACASEPDDLAGILLEGIHADSRFYFVHSYHAKADNPQMAATADYSGLPFAAVVGRGSVVGTQFHPEKSGPAGLELLRRFAS